jgi:hypothetical protein
LRSAPSRPSRHIDGRQTRVGLIVPSASGLRADCRARTLERRPATSLCRALQVLALQAEPDVEVAGGCAQISGKG